MHKSEYDADMMFCGYEVPKNIHRLTKMVLRKLSKDGIVIVHYDDQFGRVAMEQLEEIAGAIGLTFSHVCNHHFIIADEHAAKRMVMELESEDRDFDELGRQRVVNCS